VTAGRKLERRSRDGKVRHHERPHDEFQSSGEQEGSEQQPSADED